MLLVIPVLPLLAALAALGFGRRLPYRGGELIIAAVALSFVGLVLVPRGTAISATWFESAGYRLTVGLAVTPLASFIAMIVAGVAFGVSLYSLGYMAGKDGQPRFFAELGLFVGAMLALVLANSFVLLFAAWELVGLASWLLIGFNHAEPGAARAASKAFLMTRIGDMGLLLGWLLALAALGTTDIDPFLHAIGDGKIGVSITLIAFFILAGAIGKSAQLPLTAWLPEAMIGPTPVSALLHSATMVAAGVFLILRLYPLFEAVPAALVLLFWIGAVTAVVAGLIATAEMDLKRVLAWSTASQLGEMMIALGLGGPLAASLHLAAHAAFKSTLFLASGVVQEETGTRGLDRFGSLIRALPFTGGVFLIAALALAGIPPLSGFWSEDAILAAAARHGVGVALLIVLLMLLASIYIGRAAAATFFGEGHWPAGFAKPRWAMRAGMGLGALLAAGLGWLLAWRLPAVLPPFPVEPDAAGVWRIAAVLAAVLGLALGASAGWRRAAPALGPLPARLGMGLMAVSEAPAAWMVRLARMLDTVESSLDAVAERTAGSAWSLARNTERTEAFGFGRGGDSLAAGIAASGERLRALQPGRLYLYTLALFVWAAAALAAGILMLWL
ncbi:MAG TPA: proton-conducting transporter membrane subunit [Stellaceae bacterium]|nr:proton-conducting transporter membrane subunit [Stellaceae bacterium]